jgi:hypothetical protein
MGRDIIDLYSDYLLYSSGQTTATGLSAILEGNVSHEKITRTLSSEILDEKTLWKRVKKFVRAYEEEEACLVFDDIIIEKPYMDENEIICWHFDHNSRRSTKNGGALSNRWFASITRV